MNNKQILIIDDEPDIREIAKISLNITKHWNVLTACSGLEGVKAAEQHQPDAILLDLILPEMGGLEILRRLKIKRNTVAIPVLLLTATANLAMKPDYAELGVQGILVKPFDPGTLGEKIEALLGWNLTKSKPD